VLRQLRADKAGIAEQMVPAHSYRKRPAWRLVLTVSAVALLVSAALAAVFVVTRESSPKAPAPEVVSSEISTTSQTVELPPVQVETAPGQTKPAPGPSRQQSAPTTPSDLRFEVATLRPESPQAAAGDEGQQFLDCQGTNGRLRGGAALAPPLGRCIGRHVSVMNMMSVAYGLDESDWLATLRAGNAWPEWINQPRTYGYQLEAKAENPATTTKEQLQQMLQALLSERFKLKVSWQTGEIDGYVLVRANVGPRLKEASAAEPLTSTRRMVGDTALGIVTGKASMREFAQFLGAGVLLFSRVTDGTDLKGVYEINLSAVRPTPPRGGEGGAAGGPRGGGGVGGSSAGFDAMQDSLREQMGLQLIATKIPVKLVVIDHVEIPPSN
jgi:uncharacterized protein (TIGR03435 family)